MKSKLVSALSRLGRISSLVLVAGLIQCARTVAPPTGDQNPYVPDTTKLNLITWNLRTFPLAGNATIRRVQRIMDSLQADVYGLEEIQDTAALRQIVDNLPNYEMTIDQAANYLYLAVVYRTDRLELLQARAILTDHSYEFASRPPLKTTFRLRSDSLDYTFSVITVHLKCCGGTDNIQRRRAACEYLHSYLRQQIQTTSDTNVVVLGDWNDDFADPDSSGWESFAPFLTDSLNFRFVTWELAFSASDRYDSYPGWPSFLDHILISRALFDENQTATISTLLLDNIYPDYNQVLSDHRPVSYRFRPIP